MEWDYGVVMRIQREKRQRGRVEDTERKGGYNNANIHSKEDKRKGDNP